MSRRYTMKGEAQNFLFFKDPMFGKKIIGKNYGITYSRIQLKKCLL